MIGGETKMQHTYVASDNTAGDAQVLGDRAGVDVYVKKVLFGTLADGKITKLYNKRVAYGHASGIGSTDSGSVAFKITQPTAAAGKDWVREVDFTSVGSPGLRLDGGSFHTDASDVTVIWEYADGV